MENNQKFDGLLYEEAYSELEKLVKQLENEQLPLEQTISLFEKGKKLVEHCQSLLDKAELKINQLTSQEIQNLIEKE